MPTVLQTVTALASALRLTSTEATATAAGTGVARQKIYAALQTRAKLKGAGAGRPILEDAMSELDDFLTPTVDRQVKAEQALVNGDPGLRLAMTSTRDPVTVFGAKVPIRSGWDEVSETLRWLAVRSGGRQSRGRGC